MKGPEGRMMLMFWSMTVNNARRFLSREEEKGGVVMKG